MQTKRISGLAALRRELKKDMHTVDRRVQKATERLADIGRMIAFGRAPVAFGNLRETIIDEPLTSGAHARGARIRATAPYAAAVEVGSRPHTPPLAPILAWVKLRAMQGINVRESGGAPVGHAAIANQVSPAGASSTSVAAPMAVAVAIQKAIAKNGTKPTWFMKETAKDLLDYLDPIIGGKLSEPL